MEWSLSVTILVSVLLFVVATLYSSVGHGGATGYLAVLSFFAVPPGQMAGTALMLNVLVAGMASMAFVRARHLVGRLLWPFVFVSVPAAFLGGYLRITDRVYFVLLAVALMAAAFRLGLAPLKSTHEPTRALPVVAALPLGGAIGLFSGMIGIGGGVLLSPILILARWATAKQSAAVAAIFIVANSLAGLGGRAVRGTLDVMPVVFPLMAAFAGGLLGSHLGANKFSGVALRRVLAVVLVLAAVKLLWQWR
jgi:uncharacterized membrane protein YfcA